jgi:hypothetical protein
MNLASAIRVARHSLLFPRVEKACDRCQNVGHNNRSLTSLQTYKLGQQIDRGSIVSSRRPFASRPEGISAPS